MRISIAPPEIIALQGREITGISAFFKNAMEGRMDILLLLVDNKICVERRHIPGGDIEETIVEGGIEGYLSRSINLIDKEGYKKKEDRFPKIKIHFVCLSATTGSYILPRETIDEYIKLLFPEEQ